MLLGRYIATNRAIRRLQVSLPSLPHVAFLPLQGMPITLPTLPTSPPFHPSPSSSLILPFLSSPTIQSSSRSSLFPCLATGAIRVNPWSVDSVSDGMYSAIRTPLEHRRLRHEKHWKYVSNHTVAYWAQSYIGDLQVGGRRRGVLTCRWKGWVGAWKSLAGGWPSLTWY